MANKFTNAVTNYFSNSSDRFAKGGQNILDAVSPSSGLNFGQRAANLGSGLVGSTSFGLIPDMHAGEALSNYFAPKAYASEPANQGNGGANGQGNGGATRGGAAFGPAFGPDAAFNAAQAAAASANSASMSSMMKAGTATLPDGSSWNLDDPSQRQGYYQHANAATLAQQN